LYTELVDWWDLVDLMVRPVSSNKFVLQPWCFVFLAGLALGYELSINQFGKFQGQFCRFVGLSGFTFWLWSGTLVLV
jgi:hypothetical protein